MANSTALDVMRYALQQYRYTEWPPGSNKTKFGKTFGQNGEPWCAEFVWCSGEEPAGSNPIAKSANAADIQDLTVRSKGGKYILKHTANNKKKLAALPLVMFGDNISFNFNGGSSRQHTGMVVGRCGNHIYCIEGNTSLTEKGSQSNGGAVALRKRYYTTGVCIDRPAYAPHKFHEPSTPYKGIVPKLPSRGWIQYGDGGDLVEDLQQALTWANGYKLAVDGDFRGKTFAEVVIFQVAHGCEPDGQWGAECQRAFKKLVDKHKGEAVADDKKPEKTPAKKTLAQKLNDRITKDAYAKGVSSKVYAYPGGKPKAQYKTDLNKAYPHREHWSKQTAAGAACDVFVPVLLRVLGICPGIPHGLEDMIPWLETERKKKGAKFERIKPKKDKKGYYFSPAMLKGGDWVVLDYKGKGTGAHTFYVYERNGKKYKAEAQYHGKTYPHVSSEISTIRKDKYDMCRVYRARG